MSNTAKINVSMIASVVAVVVSVGGVLFGAGNLYGKAQRNERDIIRNTQAIETVRGEVLGKLDSISARVDRILENQ